MRRFAPGALALALAVSACTGEPRAPSGPSPEASSSRPAESSAAASPSPDDAAPIVLDVVADLSPASGSVPAWNTYVDGMRLANEEVNAAGGVAGRPLELVFNDSGGEITKARQALQEALVRRATALIYAGSGSVISELRPQLATTGTPVVLLEGDLYTSRELFPQVFQTTIPWVWQASAIARYIVVDRGAEEVAFAADGPGSEVAMTTLQAALEYWGGRLASGFTSCPCPQGLERASTADWVVVYGATPGALGLVNAIEEIAESGPGITGPASLLVPDPSLAQPEPGTSASYAYTWAGWAEPIPRVRSFIERFESMFGRRPSGLEQEGFDAVRIVADGLRATGGRGGDELVRAIEDLPERTFSSFPIDFGPDDHLFLPRSELGLFAVPGPRETLDPWQARGTDRWLWRPIMRTFTYNGERTSVLEGDRRVFFPGWGKSLPAPTYTESRYGIVTGHSDPLH